MPVDVDDDAIGPVQDRHSEQKEAGSSPSYGSDKLSTDQVTQPEEIPTEEEVRTLRRVPAKIPLKIFTIAFVELCERFSFYGTVIVYTNFIQQPLPPGSRTGAGGADGQSGALGMGQQAATGITTFNTFWQYLMPLLGAWVADAHWGRYKTISVALGIDLVGHLIVIVAAIPPVIGHRDGSLAALIIAMLVIGFGTGGFKPNISPLIIEQLPEKEMRVRILASGERVVVDPAVTMSRVYSWFYLFINLGSLVGQLSMVYAEKFVGFWLSFVLPTVMLSICPAVMAWGRSRYIKKAPQGSVLGKALKTFFLANKGRWSVNPVGTWKRLHDGTFWENVKPSGIPAESRPRWMTFDDAWVDELRRGFAACAVFAWYPIYWLTYNQLNNNLVSQAATMDLHRLPNDVLSNLDPVTLIIFIPICDFVLYPALRRARIRFTPIRKITAGFYLGAGAMVWSAVVQYRIYQRSECGPHASASGCAPVDISVWAQTGAYVLIALSEIFASISSLEYAYSKAPQNMRSLVQAVSLFMTAISAALGEGFVSLSADPLLVWNYAVMAVLALVAGTIFWIQFRELDSQEDELNALPEGQAVARRDEEGIEHKRT